MKKAGMLRNKVTDSATLKVENSQGIDHITPKGAYIEKRCYDCNDKLSKGKTGLIGRGDE